MQGVGFLYFLFRLSFFSFLSPCLLETARNRLKYYDGPNGSFFISMLLHNFEFCSEFRILIPNSDICTTNFGIRNCEVYMMWASSNRKSTLEGI